MSENVDIQSIARIYSISRNESTRATDLMLLLAMGKIVGSRSFDESFSLKLNGNRIFINDVDLLIESTSEIWRRIDGEIQKNKSEPPLTKGEFETSSQYKERVASHEKKLTSLSQYAADENKSRLRYATQFVFSSFNSWKIIDLTYDTEKSQFAVQIGHLPGVKTISATINAKIDRARAIKASLLNSEMTPYIQINQDGEIIFVGFVISSADYITYIKGNWNTGVKLTKAYNEYYENLKEEARKEKAALQQQQAAKEAEEIARQKIAISQRTAESDTKIKRNHKMAVQEAERIVTNHISEPNGLCKQLSNIEMSNLRYGKAVYKYSSLEPTITGSFTADCIYYVMGDKISKRETYWFRLTTDQSSGRIEGMILKDNPEQIESGLRTWKFQEEQ